MNEHKLYMFLKENYFKDLCTKEDQFSKYDCYSDKYKIVMELKCRKTHYNDLMLEKIKYDALMKHERPFYVNSTPEGIFFFNVKNINPKWAIDKMPKQTEFENTEKIDKTYCLINIKDAFLCIK